MHNMIKANSKNWKTKSFIDSYYIFFGRRNLMNTLLQLRRYREKCISYPLNPDISSFTVDLSLSGKIIDLETVFHFKTFYPTQMCQAKSVSL